MSPLRNNSRYLLYLFCCSFLAVLLNGCMVWKKSTPSDLTDGFYKYGKGQEKQVVYLDLEEQEIQWYKTTHANQQYSVDTLQPIRIEQLDASASVVFSTSGLDIDLLTIPFKLRASASGVPAQLNTNLSGAIFFGHKTDVYKVDYGRSPLNEPTRHINHFGYSLGIFTGIGNTAMTPTTTGNAISTEYDGIVWLKGVSAIFAINNISVGLTLGFDNLLDRDNDVWIYESKPWLGLALGLNLN